MLKLSIDVRSDSESFPAKLTMQVCGDHITFITKPDKGAPGDEAALAAIARIEAFCKEANIHHKSFDRKSAEDDGKGVTDMISIYVRQK